jgi:hypothetical protein
VRPLEYSAAACSSRCVLGWTANCTIRQGRAGSLCTVILRAYDPCQAHKLLKSRASSHEYLRGSLSLPEGTPDDDEFRALYFLINLAMS